MTCSGQWHVVRAMAYQFRVKTSGALAHLCSPLGNPWLLCEQAQASLLEDGRPCGRKPRNTSQPLPSDLQLIAGRWGRLLKPELPSWSIESGAIVIDGYFRSQSLGKFVIHQWITDTVRNLNSYLRKSKSPSSSTCPSISALTCSELLCLTPLTSPSISYIYDL